MSDTKHRNYIRLTVDEKFRYYPDHTDKQILLAADPDLSSKVIVAGIAVFDLDVTEVYATSLYASADDIPKGATPPTEAPQTRESKIKKPKG